MCGAGFWAGYQLAAWQEIEGVRCHAICDPDQGRAQRLAQRFGIEGVHTDAATMLANESFDFVDIVASPPSHEALVLLACDRRLPVICQKPLADDWAACQRMVQRSIATGTWLAVHENWRWQSTLRRVKQLIDSHELGRVFRCRVDMISSFDVFANQPVLREKKKFIIADLGCHLLDYVRSLIGEADWIVCQTQQVRAAVMGEDTATAVLSMNRGETTVVVNMAYAGTPLGNECFPQTLLFAEGSLGSLEVLPNYRVRVTTGDGTAEESVAPKQYPWVDGQYAIVQSSMVDCHRHLLSALRRLEPAETSGVDNLQSMRLVFAAYESARGKKVIHLA
jgi:predicted dehydrogenase